MNWKQTGLAMAINHNKFEHKVKHEVKQGKNLKFSRFGYFHFPSLPHLFISYQWLLLTSPYSESVC